MRFRACGAAAAQSAAGVHRLVADQLADIGDDPVLAGLDEPVVVELADILLDEVHLLGDDAQQGAQRVALIDVAHPVNGRDEVIEAVGAGVRRRHRPTSVRISVSGMAGVR